MAYEHLKFSRESPLPDRHKKNGFPRVPAPDDPRAFGSSLRNTFIEARQPAGDEIPGFDDRILFKVKLRDGVALPELEKIPGVQLVSHEDKSIVLAFADQNGLANFESRLSSLARDGKATRKELLYALQSFEHWTAEDRKGVALKMGYPQVEPFILDVELWPLDREDQRNAMFTRFLADIATHNIVKLDDMKRTSLVMVRVRCTRAQAETVLLKHRDVRMVDLPPRSGVSIEILMTDINQIPPPTAPAETAPAVAVLDSGLTTGHPILANAVGDSQGYIAPQNNSNDNSPNWHGTFVSGLALYGDVHDCLQQGQFIPQLRLFSGKVFEDDDEDQTEFVEKSVEKAVRDLHDQYGCKVFNLSYGDYNKVYDGRHVRGLAYTLDRLTRELDVLFVVPTGNLRTADLPVDPRSSYPGYLLEANARLLDPAPALNALTVGGLARYVATRGAQNYENTIEALPIAQAEQPFPLGRCGPSIGGAIKPDLVEHAGNVSLMRNGGGTRHAGLGVLSSRGGFADGRPFAEDIGTSYAAPQVAHRAARLIGQIPDASSNLLRALLAAHARWPQACIDLLNSTSDAEAKKKLSQLVGYGRIDDLALYRSVDQAVTLLAEDNITNDKCHFYELPVPDCFWSSGNRQREISIALAYSPDVRTTRLDYRMSKLWFNLVKATDIDEVEAAFKKNRDEGMGEIDRNRWLSNKDRKAGTLQVSRWEFKLPPRNGEKIFAVVTRQDTPWGTVADGDEPYSLVAVLADRENVQANLYAEVRTQLEARARARARV